MRAPLKPTSNPRFPPGETRAWKKEERSSVKGDRHSGPSSERGDTDLIGLRFLDLKLFGAWDVKLNVPPGGTLLSKMKRTEISGMERDLLQINESM